MTDMISRSAVLEEARSLDSFGQISRHTDVYVVDVEDIKNLPSVNDTSVVHNWVKDDLGNTYCSKCHKRIPYFHCYDEASGDEWDQEIDETPFCMHCGIKIGEV